METKKNTNAAYESPAIETVELVLEESVLSFDSNTSGGGGNIDDSDSELDG